MVSATHTRLDAFVDRHAEAGDWPGGVYAAGPAGSEPLWHGACGRLATEPDDEPASPHALYDLASLTKALVLTPLAILLARQGVLDLEDTVERHVPEWRASGRPAPSVRDLLLHRAGFPPWLPLYRLCRDPAGVPAAIAAHAGSRPAESAPVYTCLGPILAGIAMERAAGDNLRVLLDERLREPLGIGPDELLFAPLPPALARRSAPTERGRAYEETIAGDGLEGRDIVPGERAVIRGDVHDGNARFLGGAAGNAGAFATARAVFRLASALARPGPLLEDTELRSMRQSWGVGGECRILGFQSGAASAAPSGRLGPSSYGHVGFTGTSVWIEPAAATVAVLMTNRVHPRYREAPMQQWRTEFHSLVAGLSPEADE